MDSRYNVKVIILVGKLGKDIIPKLLNTQDTDNTYIPKTTYCTINVYSFQFLL